MCVQISGVVWFRRFENLRGGSTARFDEAQRRGRRRPVRAHQAPMERTAITPCAVIAMARVLGIC